MELKSFLEEWAEDLSNAKTIFTELKELLESLADASIEFIARPGITFSLRASKTTQDKFPLFVMVDVIDDDPSDRWLSVCFYGDNITDPDELGDFVPGGLLGQDGHCFDVEDADQIEYIKTRIREAYASQ